MGTGDSDTIRVDEIWIEAGKIREVVGHIINEVHVIIGIDTGKFYPAPGENLVKRENRPDKKGQTAK
ncbi:hypothetical protein ES703_120054 [subsurface metagenome]